MAVYGSFAAWYDQVFPLREEAVAFLAGLLPGPSEVLDLGCATGALALALARRGHRVAALDADGEMVARARDRARERGETVDFRAAPMETAADLFRGRRFALVTCLGNTLVHLPGPVAVGRFLRDLRPLLAPGGRLAVQVVNYRRIGAEEATELPPIDREQVRFRRRYRPRGDGSLLFETELRVKASGQVVRGAVPLFPLLPETLEGLLEDAGFAARQRLAGFGGGEFAPDSPGLLVLAGAED